MSFGHFEKHFKVLWIWRRNWFVHPTDLLRPEFILNYVHQPHRLSGQPIALWIYETWCAQIRWDVVDGSTGSCFFHDCFVKCLTIWPLKRRRRFVNCESFVKIVDIQRSMHLTSFYIHDKASKAAYSKSWLVSDLTFSPPGSGPCTVDTARLPGTKMWCLPMVSQCVFFLLGFTIYTGWWEMEHEWIMTFHNLGISSSQLTILFRGVETTNQYMFFSKATYVVVSEKGCWEWKSSFFVALCEHPDLFGGEKVATPINKQQGCKGDVCGGNEWRSLTEQAQFFHQTSHSP